MGLYALPLTLQAHPQHNQLLVPDSIRSPMISLCLIWCTFFKTQILFIITLFCKIKNSIHYACVFWNTLSAKMLTHADTFNEHQHTPWGGPATSIKPIYTISADYRSQSNWGTYINENNYSLQVSFKHNNLINIRWRLMVHNHCNKG